MRKQRFLDMKQQLIPEQAVEQALLRAVGNETGRKKRGNVFRASQLLPVAACLVLLIGGALVYSNLANPPQEQAPAGILATGEIRGLPVTNHRISQSVTDVQMDRIVFTQLPHFLENGADRFVIVQVTGTRLEKLGRSERFFGSEQQVAQVKVLQTVWGETQPASFSVKQPLSGGCTGDEAANLLRTGGVYLLPLHIDAQREDEGVWLMGDLDVLFEIDDAGLVWSHSDVTAFNQYDGKPYTALADAINRMTQDDDQMLAASPFGMRVRNFALAEVAVTSRGVERTDTNDNKEIVWQAALKQNLSRIELPQLFEIHAHLEEDGEMTLEQGERYLLLLDPYDGTYFIRPSNTAAIRADATIAPEGQNSGNAFAAYSGLTVEQIAELASRVHAFMQTQESTAQGA